MRSGMIIALVAVVAMALIARGCSESKDSAATNVEKADNAVAGDKAQPAEFSLSANDDEGIDLPEREEIRQQRKLTPGTEVFVVGTEDLRVDTSHTYAFVIGINGNVKVETADTDIAEVLVVRSARKREDLQRQKVEISNDENLYIRVGDNRSLDSLPEVRQRVLLRLPREAGLEIREIGGDVTVAEIGGHLGVYEVTGNVRAARVAGPVEASEVNGAINVSFAPLTATSIKIGGGVNGDIDLRFEGEVNADLNAWSINGAIKPDFPKVEIRERILENEPVWSRLKARIGNGGSRIEIHDVNGNVTLSKAGNASASALKAAAK